ncbi:DUF3108 domain-containing protein [Shewanella sp. NKUCC06_TVS]|uniref:DUF3108 domain-containing protein n=1 Tax=Shewanella sp. NKUCC06_TVS TaxID=2842128 RepID=UPI000DEA7B61|nr:DUF3108 domain-containing protein [Shewanella sp. NKUCC06_TVS]MBW3530139.1 DUF3108 domain-containing protein [Shewanella sp. NKUCC06_TVS]
MRTIPTLLVSFTVLTQSMFAMAAPTPLTPQTAEYQVNYGDIELGKAKYTLPNAEDGVFKYRFDSDLSLLLLTDVRHILSEFTQNDSQLSPLRYLQQRQGVGPNYTEQTAFAKAQGFIHTRYKDEKGKFPYDDKIFDPLMVQLQFRLDMMAGKEVLDYKMVKDNEVDEYKFHVIGKERMNIDSGSYDTVKIEVVRDNKKRQTFFWMAPDLAYLPVRLTHFEKGSKQLDIKLLKYHFDEVPNQETIPADIAEKPLVPKLLGTTEG